MSSITGHPDEGVHLVRPYIIWSDVEAETAAGLLGRLYGWRLNVILTGSYMESVVYTSYSYHSFPRLTKHSFGRGTYR